MSESSRSRLCHPKVTRRAVSFAGGSDVAQIMQRRALGPDELGRLTTEPGRDPGTPPLRGLQAEPDAWLGAGSRHRVGVLEGARQWEATAHVGDLGWERSPEPPGQILKDSAEAAERAHAHALRTVMGAQGLAGC